MEINWLQEVRSVVLYFNDFDRFNVNGNNWFDNNNGLSRGMTWKFALRKYNENLQKFIPKTLFREKYSFSFQKSTEKKINIGQIFGYENETKKTSK